MSIDPASQPAVQAALLGHLHGSLGLPGARYRSPPRRIFGGNQSFVYGLELGEAGDFRGPLILRILRPFLPGESVAREAAIQNALLGAGYPVARVLYACVDPAIVGGAFQLMERLPGAPLVSSETNAEGVIGPREALTPFASFVFGRWPEQVAELQHRLHRLPLDPLLEACAKAGIAREGISFETALARLATRAEEGGLAGLHDAFAWLATARGFDGRPPVLCHGDFFPNQVLGSGGRITGVIDWSDVCIAPAELDVAILATGMETLPVPFGALGRRIVRRRARRFAAAYARRAPLDAAALEYAEAFRCTHSLLAIGERRRALSADPDAPCNPNPYDTPEAAGELADRVRRLTGCRVELGIGAA